MTEDHVDRAAGAPKVAVTAFPWRSAVAESAGYAFLIWAAVIAFNVYTFNDAAASGFAAQMSHAGTMLTHLPRNVALVFALLLILAAGIGPGDFVLRLFRIAPRDLFDRIAFATASGLAVFTSIAYLLAAVHLMRFAVEAALLTAFFIASVVSVRRWVATAPRVADETRVPRALTVLIWLALGAAFFVALIAALTPDVGFDARYYHLTEAERYAQHGGFYNLVAAERIAAFALPHYQETLYAFGWVLFGQIGAKLFAWGDAVVTVLVLLAFARMWFSSAAVGLVAALVLFASPVVMWSATTANNDLAAIPFVVLALHAMLTWRTTGSRAALAAAGVFAGLTYGVKTFGAFTFVAIAVAIAITIVGDRRPRRDVLNALALYAACALVAVLPAIASAAWMVGDPIYPIAVGIFPNRYGTAALGSNLNTVVASRLAVNLQPVNLFALPWRLTVDSAVYRNLIGPIWLCTLPLWCAVPFLAPRHARLLSPLAIVAGAYTVMVVVSGAVEFRYLEPILPIVALLIGYGVVCLDWRRLAALRVMVVTALLVFALLGNGLAMPLNRNSTLPQVMGAPYLNWDYAYAALPDSAVQLQYVPIIAYANEHLDPLNDRIYDASGIQVMNLYSEIEIFNGTGYGSPAATGEWTLASPDAYARLRETGCTYVVLPKTTATSLRTAPGWRHLRFVVSRPSMNGPAVPDELYKVVR